MGKGNKANKPVAPAGPAANTGATSTPGATAPAPSSGGSSGGMSATAGPISAATGATGSGAGNYTSGLAGVTVPKMQQVTNGDLNNPASIANLVQNYQNQSNNANAQRYQQAIGVMGQAQNSTNALYGAANSNIAAMGQQQLGRIGEQLNQDLGAQANSAVSRGLSNTTIADTMQYLPKRQANDATLGVNQAVAQMQNSNDLSQAGSQMDYGKSIAGLMQSLNQQGPDLGQYANLAKDSFAGNNGQGFPQRSGTIGGNPPPMGNKSSGPSSPSAPGVPGYMNMADPSQNTGMGGNGFTGSGGGGGGGGQGNFSQTGGAGSDAAAGGGAGSGEVNYWQGMQGGSIGLGTQSDGWGPANSGANQADANGSGDNTGFASAGAGAGSIASAVGSPQGGQSAGGGGVLPTGGGQGLGSPHPSVDGLVMVGGNQFGPIWGTPDELGQYGMG